MTDRSPSTFQGFYPSEQDILAEKARLFELISENSLDMIVYCTPDAIVRFISDAVHSLLGYDSSEIIGQSVFDFFYPDDVERVKIALNKETILHYRCRHKNGTYLWFEQTTRMAMHPTLGSIIFSISRNVTERFQMEQRLQRSEKSLLHAQSIAMIGTWDWDFSSQTMYVSETFSELLGFPLHHNEAPWERLLQCVHPNDLPGIEDAVCHALLGTPLNLEFRIFRPDRHIRSLHTQASVSFDDNGNPVRIIGVIRDITNKKENRRLLRESQERYRSIVKYNPDGVCSLDTFGHFVEVNERLEEITGYTAEELHVLTFRSLLVSQDLSIADSFLDDIMHGFAPDKIELTITHKSGQPVIVTCKIVPIVIDQVIVGIYAIVKDITEEKTKEELLRKSEMLSAIGQLAAGVAHEIRNPLTSLKGFVQLLRSNADASKHEYFNIMLNELARIDLIASEMLVLAKPQATQFKVCNIQDTLRSVIAVLDSQATLYNVQIVTEFHVEPLLVSCEQNQLKQVFVNLIKNAIEAMPSGGIVTIRVIASEDHVMIMCMDQGKGIPKKEIARLGQPFYTTKEKGTGLGLMITHNIIEAHNGSIQFSSEVGSGTTVCVQLPRVKGQ